MEAVPRLEELLPELNAPSSTKRTTPVMPKPKTAIKPAERKSGRSRWVWAAVAAGIAVLVGVIFLLSRGDATEKVKDEPRIAQNHPEQSPDKSSEKKPSQDKPSDRPGETKEVPDVPPPPPPRPPKLRDKDETTAPAENKPAEEPIVQNAAEDRTKLGIELKRKGDWDGAIAEFRQAIRLKEDMHSAHCNLGMALLAKDKMAEAIRELRRAIQLSETCALAPLYLSIALDKNGDWEGSLTAYRQAIHLDPKTVSENKILGPTLRRLVDRLPGILNGESLPVDPNDRLLLADICRYEKRLYGWAARLAAAAFKDKPALANSLKSGNRYNAACCAALAGCGKGKDAGELHESARLHWLRQALDWLRADFKMLREQLGSADAKTRSEARRMLRHWRNDPDLACVRDVKELAALPEGERPDWRKLWQEVERVLK